MDYLDGIYHGMGRIQFLHLLLGSINHNSCLSFIDLFLRFRSSCKYVYYSIKSLLIMFFRLVIAFQIHGFRYRNIFLLEYVPYTLFGLGIITILGGLAWFAVTMINMNAGFLTKETFLLERLRFRGNAFKDLKYREESFHLVTSGRVPPRVFILTAFVNQ